MRDVREGKVQIVFVDTEVGVRSGKLRDIGALSLTLPAVYDGAALSRAAEGARTLHSAVLPQLGEFSSGADFAAAHNGVRHDFLHVGETLREAGAGQWIDTLYLSALLFPRRPSHRLLKDDHLLTGDQNNPLSDAKKCMEVFLDECAVFAALPAQVQEVYAGLLGRQEGFSGFFALFAQWGYGGEVSRGVDLDDLDAVAVLRKKVRTLLNPSSAHAQVCAKANLQTMIRQHPVELAYCIALILARREALVPPAWLRQAFPLTQDLLRQLRGTPCGDRYGCPYCRQFFNPRIQLHRKFHYSSFRTYAGEPLQQRAVEAAIQGKSLIAVFPTGGGKSLTFQLPALIAAETVQGLTLVISPLQSLMKDQVDSLARRGIPEAATINGSLNPVERAQAIESVREGVASILYLSPESLRSRTIERLVLSRNVVRVVVDEAHCFSSWGQDFRVDYLYIGDFIRMVEREQGRKIPVSCFTATAKPAVIADICEYFRQKLGAELVPFTTRAVRTNLHYQVLRRDTDEEKFQTLRGLIQAKDGPTIVYVSRTKRAEKLAARLAADGISAAPYHGQMEREARKENQERFLADEIQVIVATSAFGMGVDKSNVVLVVHYDISGSLEDYTQEAGRAGRDEHLSADCVVLYSEQDLGEHFSLLSQGRLSIREINQMWVAVKHLTRQRSSFTASALELAREAGWDETVGDVETRVRTALMALEQAGYLVRGRNCPHVYASSIRPADTASAAAMIRADAVMSEQEKTNAVRIISMMMGTRSRADAGNDDAESRIDYIADLLGLTKADVISAVERMRSIGVLAQDQEMTALVRPAAALGRERKKSLQEALALERFLLDYLRAHGSQVELRAVNEAAQDAGLSSSISLLRTLIYFWILRRYIRKPSGDLSGVIGIDFLEEEGKVRDRFARREAIAVLIRERIVERAAELLQERTGEGAAPGRDIQSGQSREKLIPVSFSLVQMERAVPGGASQEEVAEAILYLGRVHALLVEGGFLVLYNGMQVTRTQMDNRRRYLRQDYASLEHFYQIRVQQIHIVGEYAAMMVRDYPAALTFVQDYFQMDYEKFLLKYFKGRKKEISRSITPQKYKELVGELSPAQREILSDDHSPTIVVAAGPGSGKTKVLVHKLASLLLLEDTKAEQLLMLTFSRSAAMEFQHRLVQLIGSAAWYVQIRTFHSFAFDLLGRVGSLEEAGDVVLRAAEFLENPESEVENVQVTRTVLVLDEAQDMSESDFRLVQAIRRRNEGMRLIAVGDDDQNIYAFRGSDSRYLQSLLQEEGAARYVLVDNYRSLPAIVSAAEVTAGLIHSRMKSEAIRAVHSEEPGSVVLVHSRETCACGFLRLIRGTAAKWRQSGDTLAVLTSTNLQAAQMATLLGQNGIPARLVQELEGFRPAALQELRFFTRALQESGQALLERRVWNSAVQALREAFAGSEMLSLCLSLIRGFARDRRKIYLTDFLQYLQEVDAESFVTAGKGEVLVSTIHRSKGREWDAVYIWLDGHLQPCDEDYRALYVGQTRAKRRLLIYDSSRLLYPHARELAAAGVTLYMDQHSYPEPDTIVLTAGLRDVNLNLATRCSDALRESGIHSGAVLSWQQDRYGRSFFLARDVHSGRSFAAGTCSKRMQETLEGYAQRGYAVTAVRAKYLVFWLQKETKREFLVLLPQITLKRQGESRDGEQREQRVRSGEERKVNGSETQS